LPRVKGNSESDGSSVESSGSVTQTWLTKCSERWEPVIDSRSGESIIEHRVPIDSNSS
jgi:hypothetical protein